MAKKLRIGRSPLTNKIYIGSVGKDEGLWLSDRTDVTLAACLAVAEHIGVGFVQTFTRKDGGPSLQIEVREVATTNTTTPETQKPETGESD